MTSGFAMTSRRLEGEAMPAQSKDNSFSLEAVVLRRVDRRPATTNSPFGGFTMADPTVIVYTQPG